MIIFCLASQKTADVQQDDFDIDKVYSELVSNAKSVLQSANFNTLKHKFLEIFLTLGDKRLHQILFYQILAVKSLDEMFEMFAQSPYWNWFDTRLLKALVIASGLVEAVELLEYFKATYYTKKNCSIRTLCKRSRLF